MFHVPESASTAHVAVHPTPVVSPADGGSMGWGRKKCHVTHSGCAQPGLVADPATRRMFTGPRPASRRGPWASSGLPPGRVSCLTPLCSMGWFVNHTESTPSSETNLPWETLPGAQVPRWLNSDYLKAAEHCPVGLCCIDGITVCSSMYLSLCDFSLKGLNGLLLHNVD